MYRPRFWGRILIKVRLLGVLVLQASLALAQNSQNSTTAATDPATKASSAQVKVDPAKEADIHKLMQLTGVPSNWPGK